MYTRSYFVLCSCCSSLVLCLPVVQEALLQGHVLMQMLEEQAAENQRQSHRDDRLRRGGGGAGRIVGDCAGW